MGNLSVDELLRELQHNIDAAHGEIWVKLSHNEAESLVQCMQWLEKARRQATDAMDIRHKALLDISEVLDNLDLELD